MNMFIFLRIESINQEAAAPQAAVCRQRKRKGRRSCLPSVARPFLLMPRRSPTSLRHMSGPPSSSTLSAPNIADLKINLGPKIGRWASRYSIVKEHWFFVHNFFLLRYWQVWMETDNHIRHGTSFAARREWGQTHLCYWCHQKVAVGKASRWLCCLTKTQQRATLLIHDVLLTCKCLRALRTPKRRSTEARWHYHASGVFSREQL